MGRPKTQVPEEELLDIAERGLSVADAATLLNLSIPTVRARIKELQASQGVILQYKGLQKIQLAGLQHTVLEAITPEKLAEASFRDLVYAFKTFSDAEKDEKNEEIKGLLSYLMEVESLRQAKEDSESLKFAGSSFMDKKDPSIINVNVSAKVDNSLPKL